MIIMKVYGHIVNHTMQTKYFTILLDAVFLFNRTTIWLILKYLYYIKNIINFFQ